MFCENCGCELKDDVLFCPKCGCRVSELQEASAPTPAVPPVTPAVFSAAPAPAKKKKFWIIPAVIGVVVIALGVAAVCNAAALKNRFKKAFSTPEEYYQYVEYQNAEEMAGHLFNIYGNALASSDFSNQSVSMDWEVILGDDGRELLESLIPYDMDWLETFSGSFDINIKDMMYNLSGSLTLGRQNVISADMVADLEEGEFFLKVPELSDKYLGINLEDITDESFESDTYAELLQGQYQIVAALDTDMLEKLTLSYLETALACIDDVEVSSDELSLGDVSHKYTKISVDIDEDTVRNMLEAVLTKLEKDKDFEELFLTQVEAALNYYQILYGDYYEYYFEDVTPETLYEDFLDGVEEMLDDMDSFSMDSKIRMNIWVDAKGNIVGREVRISTPYDKVTVRYQMVQSGRRFAFEAKLDDGYDKLEIEGSGTKSGDKLTGEFELVSDGMVMLNVSTENFDIESLKDGYLNGSLTFSLGKDLVKELYGQSYEGISVSTKYALRLEGNMKKNQTKLTVTLLHNEYELVTVEIDMTEGKGKNVAVPSGREVAQIEDEAELIEWAMEAKWDNILQNLKKGGLDTELYELLEEALEEFEDTLSWYGDY